MNRLLVGAVIASLVSFACSKKEPSGTTSGASGASGTMSGSSGSSGSASGSSGTMSGAPNPAPLDVAGMNSSVKPGDDFFRFANGGWLDKTEIPPDRAATGAGEELTELTATRTRELIETAAKSAAPDTDARKVGDFFATYLDQAAIEAKGLAPLQPELDDIAKIADVSALSRALGSRIRADVDALNATNFWTPNLFGLWIAQDLDDPSRYGVFLMQGGLMMPDRDFYLDPSSHMADIRKKFEAHVAAMLSLAQIADAPAKAKRIVALETLLAKQHAPREDSEDVHKGDNHWKRADLATKAPGLDWAAFLDAAGLAAVDDFTIWHPHATTGLAAAVKSQPLAVWKDYLVFHALEHAAAVLPKAYGDEQFAFYGGVMNGTPQQRDRWKRAVDATSAALGMAVGKLYVDKYFPPAEKARAEAMVKQLLAVFAVRIDHLDWMAPATKAAAKAKLAALKVGVGYPDKWVDYGKLQVVAGDALGNLERGETFELQRNLAKLGQPVDRGEWVMTPHLVNAVNLPVMNALNFPAAILQPPYFDPSRPEAMDYGSTGSVIGHEISHSFDDQGAMFSATGKLENWWTPADLAHFKAAAAKLAAEFDQYKPYPDVHVNGKQTLSENIADVAGLAVAFDAWRASTTGPSGKSAPTVQGFTPEQQFFIAFAQAWRTKAREAAERQQIVVDGHAPAQYRADTVRNLDAWYAAFGISDGKLFLAPPDRVKVW